MPDQEDIIDESSAENSEEVRTDHTNISRIETLEKIANLEFYGIYDHEVIESLQDIFDQNQTFSPSVRESRSAREKDDSIRKSVLNPPCFEQFRVPKVSGISSKRAQSFEKPLYDKALAIRNVLVPLSAASLICREDPAAAQLIIQFILEDLTREFQKVNMDRVIAITPDPLVRKALALDASHALRDDDIIDQLKSAKKIASTFSQKKSKGRHRPLPETNPDKPSQVPFSPYKPSSSTQRGRPKSRGKNPAAGRGSQPKEE